MLYSSSKKQSRVSSDRIQHGLAVANLDLGLWTLSLSAFPQREVRVPIAPILNGEPY
jgi:hypothetical protein